MATRLKLYLQLYLLGVINKEVKRHPKPLNNLRDFKAVTFC